MVPGVKAGVEAGGNWVWILKGNVKQQSLTVYHREVYSMSYDKP